MYNDYRDRADFLTVYVREAHPTDEWQMKSNVKDEVCYAQQKTLEQQQGEILALQSAMAEQKNLLVHLVQKDTCTTTDAPAADGPQRNQTEPQD